ncbi:hypothetical protein KC19_1G337200 [Ceratodon purpureus]|uniref:Transcription and mRNA export factor ENY2 n=1 Tax=Ceratodon purpureus TaxID=3225 RepID=A0A8T0JCI4_CERPU|nr:hypothetical protein KC19_1G337200 [Ceratodon purpureus]
MRTSGRGDEGEPKPKPPPRGGDRGVGWGGLGLQERTAPCTACSIAIAIASLYLPLLLGLPVCLCTLAPPPPPHTAAGLLILRLHSRAIAIPRSLARTHARTRCDVACACARSLCALLLLLLFLLLLLVVRVFLRERNCWQRSRLIDGAAETPLLPFLLRAFAPLPLFRISSVVAASLVLPFPLCAPRPAQPSPAMRASVIRPPTPDGEEERDPEPTLQEIINIKLIESGEKERLKELLRERLIECGWRDELKAQCRAFTRKKGRNNITVDELVRTITPKGRAMVPDNVKAELLQRIRAFLLTDPA